MLYVSVLYNAVFPGFPYILHSESVMFAFICTYVHMAVYIHIKAISRKQNTASERDFIQSMYDRELCMNKDSAVKIYYTTNSIPCI
jgi:hypothetical protein